MGKTGRPGICTCTRMAILNDQPIIAVYNVDQEGSGDKAFSRCIADVKSFDMPLKVGVKGKEYQFIFPTTTFKPMNLPGATKENL